MKQVTKQTFQLFANHVKPYWLLALFMVLALNGGVVIDIIIPIYYKKFFDYLSLFQPSTMAVNYLVGVIITILILNAIMWLLYRVAEFGNNHFQPRVMADIANTCFEYLHGHSHGFFLNKFVGALVRKVNRLVHGFEGVADKIYWDLMPLFVRMITILIVVFYYQNTIAWILLVWIIVYICLNYFYTLYKLKYDSQAAQVDSEVTAQLADTITNSTTIKIFTALKNELGGFKKLTQKQFKIRRFTWNLGSYINSTQAAFMILLEFGVFYVAIQFWHKGQFSLGDFVLIQAYLISLFVHLWNFGRVIREIYRHLADSEEMVEILNTPHEVQDKPTAKRLIVSKGAIDFKAVTFTYTKTRDVIRSFNLTIKPGEKVGLVGPSGSGKSTLTALLYRFWELESGRILIDGQNIADVNQESLRQDISLVPQDPILFHRTLFENIRYGKRNASEKEVLKAAKLAHCDEFIEKLPDGYETYVGERGIKLSGGERQRVAIARAILKNAPILVLDEATSSLDSHSELMIQDALVKLMSGKTTIVIAHRLSTIMKMDRIVVLKDGMIEELGNHQQLVNKSGGLYRKLWHLQAGGFVV